MVVIFVNIDTESNYCVFPVVGWPTIKTIYNPDFSYITISAITLNSMFMTIFPTEKHLHDLRMDKFGYASLSKKILDDVLLKMELPNCFGLYGNWGSGKSTMIHYIKSHLGGKQKKYQGIKTVYFEPWKYEYSNHKDLLLALLQGIKKSLGISDSNSTWKRLIVDALVIASGIARFASTNNSISSVSEDFSAAEKIVFDEYEAWVNKVEGFKTVFETTIREGLGDNTKLIVFIDDLDRCLPDNAVKLLEGIKNFLSVENTLFVVAIDKRVVSEMIEKKYGLYKGYGDEYIMKIVHYYYELPAINLKEVIWEILHSYNLNPTDQQCAYITEFSHSFAKEPRVAKHLVHQFCIRTHLSQTAKANLAKDSAGKQMEHLFIASFLLVKFPKLFSDIDPKERLDRLMNIRDGLSVKSNSDAVKYTNIVNKDKYITDKERRSLEAIMQYPINRGNSQEQVLDIAQLNVAMNSLKKV